MTITAGAHSSQPSLRSARAPSERWRRRVAGARSAVLTVAVWLWVVIGPFLSPTAAVGPAGGGSRGSALPLPGGVDLADHLLLCGLRADAPRRLHQQRGVLQDA